MRGRKFANTKAGAGATIATMIGFAIAIVIGIMLAFSLAAGAGIQLGGVCKLTGNCNKAAGQDQLVANLHTKHILVMEASLSTSPAQIWDYKDDSTTYDSIAKGDLNGDGINEIIASAKNGGSRVIRVVYPGDMYPVVEDVGADIYPTITTGDFDKDGRAEIAVVAHKHAAKGKGDTIIIYDEVSKYNYGGTPITLKTYSNKHFTAIAAGDFDGDEKADLALGTDDGKIIILTKINLGKNVATESDQTTETDTEQQNTPPQGTPVLPSKQETPSNTAPASNETEKPTVGAEEVRTISAYSDFNPNLVVTGKFGEGLADGLAYITSSDNKLWVLQDALKDTPKLVHDFQKKNKINGLAAGDFNGDSIDDTISLRDSDDTAWLITEMNEEKPDVTKVFDFSTDVKGIVGGKFALQ